MSYIMGQSRDSSVVGQSETEVSEDDLSQADTELSPLVSETLRIAAEKIRSGEVVAIPTETVYGIAASIRSERGLRRIFEIKARPFFDPLIVHVSSLKEAATLVQKWPPLADFIARSFWPGPLTVVLPKSVIVHPLITSGLETVAIRYPQHPIALALIREVGAPLAAPSANKFGHTSPSRVSHVESEFSKEIADGSLMVIDGGDCQVGVESTVIAFGHDRSLNAMDRPSPEDDYNLIRILRPGGVTREMLQGALLKWSHQVTLTPMTESAPMRGSNRPIIASSAGSVGMQTPPDLQPDSPPDAPAPRDAPLPERISAPGQMKHHYMPRVPLVILTELIRLPFTDSQEAIIRNALATDLGDESARDAPKSVEFTRVEELRLNDEPSLTARELYQEMRRCSELGATCLVVYKSAARSGGLWSAIWDRLSKAASFDFTREVF